MPASTQGITLIKASRPVLRISKNFTVNNANNIDETRSVANTGVRLCVVYIVLRHFLKAANAHFSNSSFLLKERLNHSRLT